ncbi:MAG: DsrE family protein [Candidatus Omnitrophica bacterium]|nr:DsrE family protein [Candidatus Omnitrophota bacterium]
MNTLIVLNRNPYDGTDVTWNALRLGEKLLERDTELRIFLMNDSIDLAKEGVTPPDGYYNLTEMLQELIAKGVQVKTCGTCLVRCGIHKQKPLIEGAPEAKMPELAGWILDSDRVISF